MKVLTSIIVSVIALTSVAQDKVHQFQSVKLNMNKYGEHIETSTVEPTLVTVDFEAGTVTIETVSSDIKELLKDNLVMHIDRQMGEIGPRYSLQLDQSVFAHFYIDSQMIIFTRNDIHPMQWGLQMLEITKL